MNYRRTSEKVQYAIINVAVDYLCLVFACRVRSIAIVGMLLCVSVLHLSWYWNGLSPVVIQTVD